MHWNFKIQNVYMCNSKSSECSCRYNLNYLKTNIALLHWKKVHEVIISLCFFLIRTLFESSTLVILAFRNRPCLYQIKMQKIQKTDHNNNMFCALKYKQKKNQYPNAFNHIRYHKPQPLNQNLINWTTNIRSTHHCSKNTIA